MEEGGRAGSRGRAAWSPLGVQRVSGREQVKPRQPGAFLHTKSHFSILLQGSWALRSGPDFEACTPPHTVPPSQPCHRSSCATDQMGTSLLRT